MASGPACQVSSAPASIRSSGIRSPTVATMPAAPWHHCNALQRVADDGRPVGEPTLDARVTSQRRLEARAQLVVGEEAAQRVDVAGQSVRGAEDTDRRAPASVCVHSPVASSHSATSTAALSSASASKPATRAARIEPAEPDINSHASLRMFPRIRARSRSSSPGTPTRCATSSTPISPKWRSGSSAPKSGCSRVALAARRRRAARARATYRASAAPRSFPRRRDRASSAAPRPGRPPPRAGGPASRPVERGSRRRRRSPRSRASTNCSSHSRSVSGSCAAAS